MKSAWWMMLAVALVIGPRVATGDEPDGAPVESFQLKDYRGKLHSLDELADRHAVVLYFTGTECPLARLYAPRMQQIHEQYATRGVAVLGISSNVQDSITELAAHARIHGIEFPILKDLGNTIADRLGATRTPEVFVLDSRRVLRYRGRIDSQYSFGSGVGLAQPKAQREDLALALDQLLAGEPIEVRETEVKGCLIGRVREVRTDSPVTYSNQIVRILEKNCLQCHREGQIAPFAMTRYEEVAGWGEMIAEVVREQRMPPWHANPEHGRFANEARLTDDEKALIHEWVDAGCPEGDRADLPPAPEFDDEWLLPREPDLLVAMTPRPVRVKAEGVESYRYYEVDPGITEDKWVRMAECRPGNRAVVHHIIVYVKSPEAHPGQSRSFDGMVFLVGFAPGTRPLVAPDGYAKRIPAGSKFVFEMHYTPIGSPQEDCSSVALVFADENDVTHEMLTTMAWNRRLRIPPRAENHEVTSSAVFDRDTTLLSLFPHMHLRGKSFRYELTYPDAKESEILLDVPRYDFNWQNSYVLAEPLRIPKGSRLDCTAIFDNSENNLANPNPDKEVRWGQQTWDEMMIGWYDIAIPRR